MIQAPNPRERAAGDRIRGGVPAGVAYTEFIAGFNVAPTLQRPVPSQAGAFCIPDPQEVSMFEGHSQSEFEDVIKSNPEFRRLYHHHKELDKKVMDAELGVLPIDDVTLARMKREKLAAKDRLTRMYATLEH